MNNDNNNDNKTREAPHATKPMLLMTDPTHSYQEDDEIDDVWALMRAPIIEIEGTVSCRRP